MLRKQALLSRHTERFPQSPSHSNRRLVITVVAPSSSASQEEKSPKESISIINTAGR